MKKIFALALVAIVSIVFGACNENAPSQPNVFICLTNGTHSDRAWERNCQLCLLSFVKEGADGNSGANIVGQQKGTITLHGDTYQCFSVPRRVGDLYLEWFYDNSSKRENFRCTVNTKANDWVRISWDLASPYGVEPGILQGTGNVY